LINRNLYKIELQNKKFSQNEENALLERVMKKYKLTRKEASYLVFTENVNNSAYNSHFQIHIVQKNGSLVDVAKASDQLNIKMLSKKVTKYFMCYPKGL
jgi:hypothetical protein